MLDSPWTAVDLKLYKECHKHILKLFLGMAWRNGSHDLGYELNEPIAIRTGNHVRIDH